MAKHFVNKSKGLQEADVEKTLTLMKKFEEKKVASLGACFQPK